MHMNAKCVASLLPLALTACMTPAAGTPSLAGTNWRFVSIDGAAPVAPETSLRFEERLSANAGCNAMTGHWHLDGEQLVLEGPLVATRMFCDGKMQQEAAVGALLAANPTVSLTGDRLTLTASGHSADLVRM